MCGRITLFLFQGFGVEALNWDLHRLRHKNILGKPGHEIPVHIARIKAMAPAIATSQTSGWVQPSSIACSANHLQVAAESLP